MSNQLFAKLQKNYIAYEEERHLIIKLSSDVLQKAKQAIFSLHRDEIKEAGALLAEAEKIMQDISTKFEEKKKLKFEGSYKAALEEYIEAKLFYMYLTEGKISEIKEVSADADDYLGAVTDYTGELLRKAVLLATEGKYKEVKKIKEEMSSVLAELIKLNLTGYLRTKYDAAKRNLKRMEEMLYEITIKFGKIE